MNYYNNFLLKTRVFVTSKSNDSGNPVNLGQQSSTGIQDLHLQSHINVLPLSTERYLCSQESALKFENFYLISIRITRITPHMSEAGHWGCEGAVFLKVRSPVKTRRVWRMEKNYYLDQKAIYICK